MKTTTLFRGFTMLFFLLFFDVPGETQVFQDVSFPYRISCPAEWTQEIKNDSIFQLRSTVAGRKTRFQLKRYTLDSTYTLDLLRWSRMNFFLNKQFADKWGAVLSFDTSHAKKLGDLRAFELRARVMQTVDGVEVVWTEYSRWTENKGCGYLALVFGDTADMRINFPGYKTLLDSVFIQPDAATGIESQFARSRTMQPDRVTMHTSVVYDLLGRKQTTNRPNCSAFVLQYRMEGRILPEVHIR